MPRLTSLVIAAVIAASSPIAARQSPMDRDSPMFRGGPSHLGVSASPAPSLKSTVWSFETGAKVMSTPAVADGVVYAASNDGNLYALNAADGALKWKFETPLGLWSSPAVSGNLVVVAGRTGFVYGVARDTGKQVWRFATGGEQRFTKPGIHGIPPRHEMMPDPFDVFMSSPTIVGNRVYIGSGDHNVYALDLASGALAWKFETGDVVHASPAVVDGVVYIGSWDRNMYALDAGTGKEVWKYTTGDDQQIFNQIGIASSAAVVNGVVYFGCRDGHFYAVDAKTGVKKWDEDNKMGWVIASPSVKDGVVYFPTSDGTQFKALNADTGALLWRAVNKAVSFSSPMIAGDAVYFGAHDGWLRALDLKTGAERYAFQTDGSKANAAKYVKPDGTINYPVVYSSPAGLDGTLAGIDRMHSLGSILSSPVIVDGVAYFGSTDGKIYAVR
jgi:outer membrane protein assembly factor BamB